MVARRAHNPKVVGSNPAPATIKGTPSWGFLFSGLRFGSLHFIVDGRALRLFFFVRKFKAISGEEHTQLAGLFVHFRRCKKGFIARYAPFFTPRQLLLRCSTFCIHAVVENEQKSCGIRIYSFLEIA